MWDAKGEGRRSERRGGMLQLVTFLDSTDGGHVEYKFIFEMSFLFHDSLVNLTCNYCCVAFNTASM